MNSDIFNILVKHCANERNDAIVFDSADYKKLQQQGQQLNYEYGRLDITDAQREIIDNMMAEQNAMLTLFSEINYRVCETFSVNS
ncbi:MAG: hypothetical protein ACLT3H_06700 [Roseburia sp.]